MSKPVRAIFYLAILFGLFWKVTPVLGQHPAIVHHAVVMTLAMASVLAAVAAWLLRQWGTPGTARAGA